jgi:hypothetical protein
LQVTGSYTPDQRRALEAALDEGRTVPCPACGGAIAMQPVQPPAEVAYVRHRVLIICSGCRRSASLDTRR